MAVGNPDRMTRDVRAGLLMPYNSYANRVAILNFVRDIPTSPNHRSAGTVAEIEANLVRLTGHPMMVFWGKRDFCFNDYYLAEWKRRFPRAVVPEFADAGHYVVEDAHERIVPLLREFLSVRRNQGTTNSQEGAGGGTGGTPTIASSTAATSRMSTT